MTFELRILVERLIDDTLSSPGTLFVRFALAVGVVVAYSGLLGGSSAIAEATGGGAYLAFILPAGVLMATFASTASGFMLVRDIEDGYVNRLLTMPVSWPPIVLAPMLVGTGIALVVTAAVLVFGALFGVSPATGIPGVLGVFTIAGLWAMGIAGYTAAAALLTRDAEKTNLVDFLSLSFLLFASPLLLPRDDLAGWIKPIAEVNPATYVIEGLRALMMDGWDLSTFAPAVAAAGVFAAVSTAIALAVAWKQIADPRHGWPAR